MTPTSLRAQLARLGLTTGAAARLVGVEPRTMQRYLAGDREIPEPVVRLLRLAETVPEVREALLAKNYVAILDGVCKSHPHGQTPSPRDSR